MSPSTFRKLMAQDVVLLVLWLLLNCAPASGRRHSVIHYPRTTRPRTRKQVGRQRDSLFPSAGRFSSSSASLPTVAPWSLSQRNRPTGLRDPSQLILQAAVGMPSNRWIATGLLAAGMVVKCVRSETVQRAVYFWRTAGPMIGHYKWTQWWLGVSQAHRAHRDFVYERLHDRYAAPALEIVVHLKGLYCKIGQVLSARPDFLPHQYVTRFATVQDSIPQWSADRVREIIQESLQTNLGYDYDDVFYDMDPVALGSASIGQVHRAVLQDRFAKLHKYKQVAVKVMHPDAQGRFQHDFQVFRWLCRVALPGWKGLLDELETRFLSEFDYHKEAASLATVRANMANSRFRRKVRVPEPLTELTTQNVLVMEMLQGRKLMDAMRDRLAESLGGNQHLAKDFLEVRRKKALSPSTASDTATLSNIDSLSTWEKVRLLLLQQRCKRYVDTLIAVHGHQILHDGCKCDMLIFFCPRFP